MMDGMLSLPNFKSPVRGFKKTPGGVTDVPGVLGTEELVLDSCLALSPHDGRVQLAHSENARHECFLGTRHEPFGGTCTWDVLKETLARGVPGRCGGWWGIVRNQELQG